MTVFFCCASCRIWKTIVQKNEWETSYTKRSLSVVCCWHVTCALPARTSAEPARNVRQFKCRVVSRCNAIRRNICICVDPLMMRMFVALSFIQLQGYPHCGCVWKQNQVRKQTLILFSKSFYLLFIIYFLLPTQGLMDRLGLLRMNEINEIMYVPNLNQELTLRSTRFVIFVRLY